MKSIHLYQEWSLNNQIFQSHYIEGQLQLNKGEFHLTELVNLKVKILENNQLHIIGKVINLANEKNNLLVIQLLKNNKEVLIPFVKEIVPIVDIKEQFIVITPPLGLLEL